MMQGFNQMQPRRNRGEREGQESSYSYNPQSFQRNQPSNFYYPNQKDQYYQNPNYNKPNSLKGSYLSGPAHLNNNYNCQSFQNSTSKSIKRDNYGNQRVERQNNSGHWIQPSFEGSESQSVSNIYSNYCYSWEDESLLSFQGLGEQNIGRYGKIEKPKKKKKKKDSKIPPPQPKTKAPSMVQQASEQCYQQYGVEQQVDMDICPFNSSHIVPKGKLLTHIGRCQQTCDNARFYKVCRYNTCHWFRIDQIEAHEMVCSDREKFKVNEQWEDPFSFPPNPKPSEKVQSQFSDVSPAATKVSIRSVKSDPVKKVYEQSLIEDF